MKSELVSEIGEFDIKHKLIFGEVISALLDFCLLKQ